MFILFYITVVLLIFYGILIGYYEIAWKKIPNFNYRNLTERARTKVSVIIPARNEADNIVKCLNSISRQTYPKELTEVIVINDHSTDDTEEMIKTFAGANIKLINLRDHVDSNTINSYKKKAIEVAIASSSGDLIITTDADCTAMPDWITCLVAYHQRYNAALIAAPVKINANRSLLSVFQSIDFLTLQGITGASVSAKFHSMCNGANLAYEKKVFYQVDGFKNIDNIASGDDMLLMHKIAVKYPDRFLFVKNSSAIVSTQPALTWTAFLHQRIRWASKADKFEDKRIFFVLMLVYFLNLCLLILLLAALWNISWLFFFLLLILIKTTLEFSFVSRVASFFKQQSLMVYFPFLQPLHIIYTVFAGWFGKFGTYEWKSRKVK